MPRDGDGNLPDPRTWPAYMHGNADAVAFLEAVQEKSYGLDGVRILRTLVPSAEAQAIRYLRPVDRAAALRDPLVSPAWRNAGPGMLGLCHPIHAVGIVIPIWIAGFARLKERSLGWHFLCDFAGGYLACAPEHRSRWSWITPEGEGDVWCGFYARS
jgi:hypothetical protein